MGVSGVSPVSIYQVVIALINVLYRVGRAQISHEICLSFLKSDWLDLHSNLIPLAGGSILLARKSTGIVVRRICPQRTVALFQTRFFHFISCKNKI